MISSNNNLALKMEEFKAKCKKAGLKITPQRMAIYKAIAESTDHPSAEMVWKVVRNELPNVSLDTVNRTLLTMSEIGAAFTVEGTGDAKRFDANMEDHQHFKCLKCKKVVDLFDEDFGNIEVPSCLNQFSILRKTVYFEGICDSCKQNDQNL